MSKLKEENAELLTQNNCLQSNKNKVNLSVGFEKENAKYQELVEKFEE